MAIRNFQKDIKMREHFPSENLLTSARKLAAVIDAAAADYPLLYIEAGLEPRLYWSYAHLEITVETVQAQEGVQYDELTSTIRVDSIATGFALVAATESIRQGRQEPYIQYQAMPTKEGTQRPLIVKHTGEVPEKGCSRTRNPA